MCLRPLHISTGKSKYFNLLNSFIIEADVPCGDCLQCVMTSKNDLYLRCLQEYRDCISSGGAALFLTFTYSEDKVPYKMFYLDPDGLINLVSVDRSVEASNVLMTFDKSHMINYLKRLRKFVKTHFGIDGCIRYICVPEYGTKNTQRPHYHCIFFLSKELISVICDRLNMSFDICNPFLDDALVDFFAHFWPYGIVSASDLGLFVKSDSCMSYVTKYVCKNSSLLNYSRFQIFFDFICDSFDKGLLSCPYGHDFSSPMSYFLYYCKFFECAFYVVKSVGFGLSLLDDILSRFDVSDRSQFESIVRELNHGIVVPNHHDGSTRTFSYPRYIKNKLFFCTRKDGSYYLRSECRDLYIEYRVQMIYDFADYVEKIDYKLFESVPSTVFSDFGCSVPVPSQLRSFSVDLPRASVPVFVYSLYLRNRYIFGDLGRSTNLLFRSMTSILPLQTDYFPSLSERDKVRLIVSLLTPEPDVSTSALSDGTTLSSCLYWLFENKLSFFPTSVHPPLCSKYRPSLEDLYVRHSLGFLNSLLDCYNVCVNYNRGTLLNYYDSINRKSKIISDILNQRNYGISKNRSRSVLSSRLLSSLR